MEQRFPIKLPPGFRNNGTEYESKGRWIDGSLVRFFQDTIRPWGGWVKRAVSGEDATNPDTPEVTFPYGVPRAAVQWAPDIIGAAQPPALAVGTTTGLYVVVDDVVYDITPAEIVADGERASRVWTLDVFGSYLIACATDVEDFLFRNRLFVWTGDTATIASEIAEAPASPTSVVVTDERFLFQLGGVDSLGPNFTNFPDTPSTRSVLWASRERLTDWTPTNVNTAGSFPLSTDGALLAGRRSRGQTLLWTTTDLHAAIFIGGEFVYRFQQMGTNCGSISIGSPVVVNGAAFWMGPKGFFAFDGAVRPIDCEVQEYVFGRLNRAAAHLVWGIAFPEFGEVVWWYPSGTSTVPDSYVAFNYQQNHWTYGELTRTCGVPDAFDTRRPLLLPETFELYDHETGVARPQGEDTLVPFLESGPIEMAGGDNVMDVQGIIPDEKTLGSVEVTVFTRLEPMLSEETYGPFPVAARTDIRANGRQVRIRFEETDPPTDWRIGVPRLLVTPGSPR
jgi:hypothetical protein